MCPQNQIYTYINEFKYKDNCFCEFISRLSSDSQLILVGGGIRDILSNQKPRDLDFIYWGNISPLILELNLKVKVNLFGGFKICFKDIEVDIWSDYNNWAFKEKLLRSSVENTHMGCFYNHDSLVCSLNENYFEDSNYQKFLKTKILDFVLDDDDYIWGNPFPALNIVRALQIKRKYDIRFSDLLEEYIFKFVTKHKKETINVLKTAELKHYRTTKSINPKVYKEEMSRYFKVKHTACAHR